MPAILSKNCIVGGELDWYCLACCALLPAAEDAVEHIQSAAHKHNLTELPYADKYKDDFIRKARGVYYCEVCNVTFPTAAKVGMHVTEATHVAGKTGRQLKRAGTAIVFTENTSITESGWNGLVDDTCVLCNVEFDNESTHKSQLNHILNLINSSVTATAANDIYRKIDGGYQCLTCNKVVHIDGITEHLNSEQHESAFLRYHQNQNEVNDIKNDDVADKESKDGDTIANTESRIADGKTLYTRPELIKEKNEAACSSDVTEVETLAKRQGLSMKKGSSVVYCSACSVHIAATLDRINEHVDGKKHKGKLAKQSKNNNQKTEKIKKVPVEDFFTEVSITTNMDIVINDKFYLKNCHYFGYLVSHHRIYCQFCRVNLLPENKDGHLISLLHQVMMKNCYVITSLEKEFVREVKRDLYHCGYCGTVENDFDDMLNHLDTAEHKICRADRERMCLRLRAKLNTEKYVEFDINEFNRHFNNFRRF